MDHNSTDASGDAPGLPESPPMSHSMVVREIKQVVEVLKELGSTPLIDTCHISLGDLSISGSESEGDADRVARCVLFPSPEQPTKTQLTSTQDSEEWLISLASPVPVAGTKDGVASASTEPGAALQGIKLEAAGASGGWLDLLSLGETKRESSKQPSTVEAGGDRLRAATTGSLDELLTVFCEEAGTANSRTSHEDLAMASGETTCAIPAVPAAPSLAAVPKKGTYNMAVADTTVTLGHSTVVHRPAEQFDSIMPGSSLAAIQEPSREEAATVGSCASEEGLAEANVETTFVISTLPTAPSTAALPRKAPSATTGAADTTVTLRGPVGLRKRTPGQPLPLRRSMLPPPLQRAGRLTVPSGPTMARGRPRVGPAAAADATFGMSKTRAPEGRLSAPKNALQAKQAEAASKPVTSITGPKVIAPLRQPVAGSLGRATAAPRQNVQAPAVGAQVDGAAQQGPLSRPSMVPGAAAAQRSSLRPRLRPAATAPPLQRAGRLTVPSGPTMARGRPRVGPAAAADATFGMSKTRAPEGRLSAPKNALQAKQAEAASKPVTSITGPKVIAPLRQPVAGSLGRATAAPRQNVQAPAVGAQVDGAAQQGPLSRPSMVPGAAAAQRSSLRPRLRPAATAPPLQCAGRLTVPSGPTMARGRPRVGPAAAADATFCMSKTRAPEGRLSAPKNALQAKQQAKAASKPVTSITGPKKIAPLRQPVARSLGRATAAPRRNVQAPAVGAQVDGAAQQGPLSRPSMVPGAAAAQRSSLRASLRPAATGFRKSVASPHEPQSSAKPRTEPVPQPKAPAAMASQLRRRSSYAPVFPAPPSQRVGRLSVPSGTTVARGQPSRARLSLQAPAVGAQVDGAAQQGPLSRPSMVPGAAAAQRSSLRACLRPAATAAGGSLPRPAASSGASSNRAPPRLLRVVESPEPTRVSSTPVRSGAPMCDGPDLTPIRKEH